MPTEDHIVEGRINGKKQSGRPRKMILDWLQEGRGYKNRKEREMNRSLWKH